MACLSETQLRKTRNGFRPVRVGCELEAVADHAERRDVLIE